MNGLSAYIKVALASSLIVAVLAGMLNAAVVAESAPKLTVLFSEPDRIVPVLKDLAETFDKKKAGLAQVVGQRDYDATLGRFLDRAAPSEIMMSCERVQEWHRAKAAKYAASKRPEPAIRVAGKRELCVIANEGLRIDRLTVDELRGLLSGNVEQATTAPSFQGMKRARCYCEREGSWVKGFLLKQAMAEWVQREGYKTLLRRAFRKDLIECVDGAEVIKKVKSDPRGIGFFEYDGRQPTGVRVVAIAATDKGQFLVPGGGAGTEGYVLTEPLLVCVRAGHSKLAEEFCGFVLSEEGSAILERHGYRTTYRELVAQGMQRLEEAKKGRGCRIQVLLPGGCSGFMGDVAWEYASTKTPVVAASKPVTDTQGMQLLCTLDPNAGGLMVSVDRPDAQSAGPIGLKWFELRPAEHLLAGRAVGVVVNAANKLDSLTLGQIQAIFNGSVDDWAVIGSTGLTAGGARGEIRINCFGLRSGEPAAGVFHKEGVAADKLQRVTAKKDTAEVLAAVGSDPSAIGFVDLAAMGAGPSVTGERSTAGNVKVLAIKIGTGDKARLVAPTPENIKNALYPLSQRLYLYVHPQASDTAKDFAKFVATCGASEATPYADVVKSVMEAYGKNGLIPLADAALERMTKDALAEAQAAAKEEAAKAKKPGKKKS